VVFGGFSNSTGENALNSLEGRFIRVTSITVSVQEERITVGQKLNSNFSVSIQSPAGLVLMCSDAQNVQR